MFRLVYIERQRKDKTRPLINLAFHPDLSAMQVHERAADRESQTGARIFSVGLIIQPVKFIEYFFLLGKRDALDLLIFHFQHNAVLVPAAGHPDRCHPPVNSAGRCLPNS